MGRERAQPGRVEREGEGYRDLGPRHAAQRQVGDLSWAWVAAAPPPPLALLPVLSKCGRATWQSDSVPGCSDMVWVLVRSKGPTH